MTIQTLKNQLEKNTSAYQTPCYVYAADEIRHHYSTLKSALGTKLMMSIKANHCTDLLYLIGSEIDGFEVASEYELNMLALLKSEFGFINNPSMTTDTIRKAVAAKTTITLDHPAQVEQLIPLKRRLKPVFLRLSSALFLDADQPLPKQVDHFGMDHAALVTAISKLNQESIVVEGIHIFRGSNTFSKLAFDTLEHLPKVLGMIESLLGYPLKSINIGGGFEPDVCTHDFNFSAYKDALNTLSGYQIMHETGRGIFASAGYFITTVVAVKYIHEQAVIVCDGGMAQNFLLAQTEKTIKKYAHPTLCQRTQHTSTLTTKAKVVGNSCNREDVIGQLPAGSPLPSVGDALLFSNCGAYNRTYSPIQFLGLPKAQEYILAEA